MFDCVSVSCPGVDVSLSTGSISVKAAAILSSNDLQAKAYLMNQTQHNGESGCSTCEETGMVVKQGKGTTRCYPYREGHAKPKKRTSETVMAYGLEAHMSGKKVKI